MNPPTARVICPTCKKSGDWFATPWGPFHSKRCKLIDRAKWLGGEHAISEPLRPEHPEKCAGALADEPLGHPKAGIIE